ncbi:MAG TPA: hypothetical protein DEA32_00640 [Firmicutes bacterium]|nr:hypothetical protein [Bacillota bacterium]
MSKVPFQWPVNKAQIILGKSIVSFVKTLSYTAILSIPIWITYGIVAGSPWYIYLLGIFYPLLVTICEVAVGFLFCVPMEGVYILLRRSVIFQIILGCLFALGLSFLYGEILNIFVKVIVLGDIDGVTQIYHLSINSGWGGYLYPSAFLVKLFTAGSWLDLLYFFCCVIGVLLLGSFIAWPTYFKIAAQTSAGEAKFKFNMPKSTNAALLSKEFSLLLRGKNGSVGLITTVVGLPVALLFIVTCMNNIFSVGNLKFVPLFFPMFLTGFTGMLILMNAACVLTCSTDSLGAEGSRLILMKLSPVPLEKQLIYKGIAPLCLTGVSFLCSMVILGCTHLVDWVDFGWITVEGLAFLIFSVFFELLADARSKVRGRKSEALWESLMPLAFPVLIYGIVILVSALVPKMVENYSYMVTKNILHACVFAVYLASALAVSFFLVKRGPKFLEDQARKAQD